MMNGEVVRRWCGKPLRQTTHRLGDELFLTFDPLIMAQAPPFER
jgi:hypothetical protein